jgi:hypothetical protein
MNQRRVDLKGAVLFKITHFLIEHVSQGRADPSFVSSCYPLGLGRELLLTASYHHAI